MQACSAITGDGLYEGLDWLGKEFKKDQLSNWNILTRLNPFYKKNSNSFAVNPNTNNTRENNNHEQIKLPADEELKDDVVFLKAFEDTLLVRVVKKNHWRLY